MKRCEYCGDLRADEPGHVNACRLRAAEDRATAAERRFSALNARIESVLEDWASLVDVDEAADTPFCNGAAARGRHAIEELKLAIAGTYEPVDKDGFPI